MNTWFISDTHFYHGNIIKYCNRPWYSGIVDENGQKIITVEDITKMNNDMISNWNNVVSKDDIVWHLGDFALGTKDNVLNIAKQLNGKINLVLGNHDHRKYSFYADCGFFNRVYDRPVLAFDNILLSHAPRLDVIGTTFKNIFGHIHAPCEGNYTSNTFNVCVDLNNYTPVSMDFILDSMRRLGKETDNGNKQRQVTSNQTDYT